MTNVHANTILSLFDYRWLQAKLAHRRKGSVEALAYVLIWWVRKLVDDADERAVPCKLLVQDVLRCDMARKLARTLYFDAIVEYAYVNVNGYAVVPVQERVGNDFMEGLRRIRDRLKSAGTELLNALDQLGCARDGILDLEIEVAFDRNWIKGESVASSFLPRCSGIGRS